jgi:hypothetical protein
VENVIRCVGQAPLRACAAAFLPHGSDEAIAPYEFLIPTTIIRYAVFTVFGARKAVQ